jgi:hypothetical protein
VDVLAQECGDTLEGPEKNVCNDIMKGREEIRPEFECGLDTADKIGVVREFVPSLTAFVIGLIGVRSGGGVARTTFAGLAVAGVGLFLFAMSDIRRVVARKVIEKIRGSMIERGFVQGNTERIVKESRRGLAGSLYGFRSRFEGVLKRGKEGLEEREGRREGFVGRREGFRRLREEGGGLREAVDEIML